MPTRKAPDEGPTQAAQDPSSWRFTGSYPANYLLPGRISSWVSPGDTVAWPDGPPDVWWEPVTPSTSTPATTPSVVTDSEE